MQSDVRTQLKWIVDECAAESIHSNSPNSLLATMRRSRLASIRRSWLKTKDAQSSAHNNDTMHTKCSHTHTHKCPQNKGPKCKQRKRQWTSAPATNRASVEMLEFDHFTIRSGIRCITAEHNAVKWGFVLQLCGWVVGATTIHCYRHPRPLLAFIQRKFMNIFSFSSIHLRFVGRLVMPKMLNFATCEIVCCAVMVRSVRRVIESVWFSFVFLVQSM